MSWFPVLAVQNDRSMTMPDQCSEIGCTFPQVAANDPYFVVHRHVPSQLEHKALRDFVTLKREMPGPGDHQFLLYGAPNFFQTPTGVFKVLEFRSGAYQVRTVGFNDSVPWKPSDAVITQPQIKKLLKQ